MKIIKRSIVIFIALSLLLAIGCGSKKEITLGEIKDNVYTNDYFGLEVKLPEGWINLDRETMNEVAKIGNEIAANGDEEKKKELQKLSEEKTLKLAMTSKYEFGSAVLNPNISISAEKVSLLQGIDTSEKYLKIYAEQLKAVEAIPYNISDEILKEEINDVEWSLLEASVNLGDGNLFLQKIYSILREGYIINVIISYPNQDGVEEVDQFIKDLKIENK